MLAPALFLVLAPIFPTLIVGTEPFWSGGRWLAFWFLAVPTFAVWGVIDWLRERCPVRPVLAVLTLCSIVMASYVYVLGKPPYPVYLPARAASFGVMDYPHCVPIVSEIAAERPSTIMTRSIMGWFYPEDCSLWPIKGDDTSPWAHHRNSYGILIESSPGHEFMYDASGSVAGMMTLGVDYYLHPEHLAGAWSNQLPNIGSVADIYRIDAPPDQWPSQWASGQSPGEWLRYSLTLFKQWDDPADVVIPVRGTLPLPVGTPHPQLWTVRPDWSDDRFIRFDAPDEGFYYVPVSYHPNWNLLTPGEGPWQAGPNQMVVYALQKVPVELRFDAGRWEIGGRAISGVTTMLIAGILAARWFRRIRGISPPPLRL